MEENTVILRANGLLNELLSTYDEKYHHTTIVSSIYDTAWVSMVRKPQTSDISDWAFPMCFDFLCQNQAGDGGWGCPVSIMDRITSTFICLLAIKKHLRVSGNLSVKSRLSLQHQAARAIEYIHLNIGFWDLGSSDAQLPIGFELWFPVVIEKLEEEGVVFEISGIDRILKLRQEKLSRFPLEVLYNPSGLFQPSPLYTLEGFIGLLDFSKLSHHLRFGSMFTSPSSTAVYLMESSVWDPEAEAYLQHVVEQSIVKHGRCVPQMFPTSTFDIDWVLNLFVDGGLDLKKLDANSVKELGNIILQGVEKQGGIMGADQHVCPDPDSTAMAYKTIYHALGIHHPVQPMIDAFEGPKNYVTYRSERDPSISSNAHVLQALKLGPDSRENTSSIEKCITYLCETWSDTHGLVQDKWSLSEYYATVALTQALSDYLVALSEERVEAVSEKLLKVYIPLTLLQAVVRILLRQNADGSWGSTSIRTLGQVIDQAVRKSQVFLTACLDAPFNDYSWNGKCAYGLLSISRAAALAAVLDARPIRRNSQTIEALYHQVDMNLITKHSTLLGHLEYFAGVPGWVIEASCLEAAFLVHEVAESTRLKRRKDLDKAFILRLTAIPIAVNYATKACLGKHVVLGMVDICEFNYHVDPLIEGIKDRSPDTMQLIEKVICQIFSDKDSSGVLQNKSEGDAITLEACQGHEEVYQLVKELEYSAKQFIEHPHVLTAGDYEQRNLRMEIRVGLLAQVSKVAMAIPDSSSAPDLSFYQFIQKIGADDTLSSMAIKSIICFIQGPSDVVCATPIERYLLEEFNRHVAIWTRMWNDHSSIERDRVDSSLNVVDFPEFQSCIEDAGKRRSLADLIQHEEDRLNESLERFASAVASRPKAGYVVTGLRWYLGILHVFREQYNAGAVYASKMM